MTLRLIALFFLGGVLCAAQSVPASLTDASANCGPGPGQTPCLGTMPAVTTPNLSASPAGMQTTTAPTEPAPVSFAPPLFPTTVVAPPLAPSEFELFAQDAAGSPLPVYGSQLFNQVPTTFAPVSHIPVPANYVIGPGDQLLIRVWGMIDLDTTVTVDRNGQIFIPKVGTLGVAGLHYDQIKDYLRAAIGRLYKGFDLNVTMGQLRSIQIFVLGSARRPGVYTVSSLSTLVDALFASGGPSATGTMRRIELRRGGRLVTTLDVYDLLRYGDMSHDAPLLPGDVIYIPPVGPQVAIMGSVNKPGIYELKGKTTIAAALKYAGGLTSLSAINRVLLERIENHKLRRVDEFPLNTSGLQRVLKDGDMLRIFPISPQIQNLVTLRGNVALPGQYAWHPGMRISDLIPSRKFLIARGYWNQQNYLVPGNIRDPFAPSSAQIISPAEENAEEEVNAGNAGNAGGQMNLRSGSGLGGQQGAMGQGVKTNLRGQLDINEARNYGEINWNYAAIERLDKHDLSTRLIAFNLGKAIDDHASPDNKLLEPGDVVTIFSQRDIPLPEDQQAIFVRVVGEVKAPGVYQAKPGETLRQVVEQAGGLTSHSYLYASQLTRVSTRLAEEQELQESINQMQRELISRYAAAPSLGSTNPAQQQQAQQSAQQAIIAQLATVRPTGRIVLEMKPNASTVADIPNFPLEDGDSFYIPARMSTVQVEGSVYNANAFQYQPGKHLSAYLNEAGGPTREADTKRIFLIRADGTVVSRQGHGLYSIFARGDFGNLTLLPGDAIIVPTKLKSPYGFAPELPFVTQILSQTALTGAVIGAGY